MTPSRAGGDTSRPAAFRVDVVLPALDEEAALPVVLAALPHTGTGWRIRRVVVADNGSRDRTPEVARAAGAEVVREPRRGYGAACLAALVHLAPDPPDGVLFLDADGSDEPADAAAILAPLVAGEADLVIGSRVLGAHEPGALTPVQAFGNALSALLLNAVWGGHVTDLGPFRAIAWSALVRLRMRDRDYGWTVEMQARALRARLRVAEVPAAYRRRRAGRSKVAGTLRGAWGAGTKILWTIARVALGG